MFVFLMVRYRTAVPSVLQLHGRGVRGPLLLPGQAQPAQDHAVPEGLPQRRWQRILLQEDLPER